ncbi:5-oxoprolinase subunit PxpB [Roseivivax sp. CAU 1753]
MTPRILSLGDRAVTVEFAPEITSEARAAVSRLDAAIAAARAEGRLNAVIDVVPTFRSLSLHYDPLVTSRTEIEDQVTPLIDDTSGAQSAVNARWVFPVLYGGESGPDLPRLAAAAGIDEAKAIALHADTEVEVYMLGFQPGFAFMGDIAPALRQPRLADPRTRVPAGSVAVADRLTAIYPWESPGGWHLIGRCPVPFFDAARDRPSLLSPSDRVSFEPVDAARYAALDKALRTGEIEPQSFRSTP